MPMPILRLSTLIREETDKGINLHKLAHLINEANQAAKTGCCINYRTLKKIRDDSDNVGLTLKILTALDTYFRKKGKSLQQVPIFETPGVLEALALSGDVVFMLGAK